MAKVWQELSVQLSAAHEQHHLDRIAAFTKVGKELGVIKELKL